MRAVLFVALLLVGLTAVAGAQSRIPTDPELNGFWSSTMRGFDNGQTPPFKFEETANLTLFPNGNVHLEVITRPLNSRASTTTTLSGVYTLLAPGLIGITFSGELVTPAAWSYKIYNNRLTIRDGNDVMRTFNRTETAVY